MPINTLCFKCEVATLVAGTVGSNDEYWQHISLPRPLGEEDPTDWFLKYEICCVSNNWVDEVKAKKLPTLLEGEPLAIWLELSEEQ